MPKCLQLLFCLSPLTVGMCTNVWRIKKRQQNAFKFRYGYLFENLLLFHYMVVVSLHCL